MNIKKDIHIKGDLKLISNISYLSILNYDNLFDLERFDNLTTAAAMYLVQVRFYTVCPIPRSSSRSSFVLFLVLQF